MQIDPINVGMVLIAIITGLLSWATQRTASKANRLTARDAAEVEAYNRARNMDLQTIERQDEEIKELGELNNDLRKRLVDKNRELVLAEVKIENQQVIIRALRRRMGLPAEPEVHDE